MRIDSFRGEYKFLSNFYLCPVRYKGHQYISTEHAYQAQGVVTEDAWRIVTYQPTCKGAMIEGRRLRDRADWNTARLFVMKDALWAKFNQNPLLANQLHATGEAELVEGNDWGDTFWGECNGVGENHLGKLLMKTRDRLRLRQ